MDRSNRSRSPGDNAAAAGGNQAATGACALGRTRGRLHPKPFRPGIPQPMPMPMPMPAEIPAFARGPEAFAAQGPPMPPAAPVRNPRRGPFRRRMSRGLRRSADLQAAEARTTRAALALPVSTCRRIAVVSVRGGAGKTTLAALLSMALAEHREDRLLAVDADAVLGSLPMRLDMAAARSPHDLAAARGGSLGRTPPRTSCRRARGCGYCREPWTAGSAPSGMSARHLVHSRGLSNQLRVSEQVRPPPPSQSLWSGSHRQAVC
jgi:hypothetical protein